MQVLITGDRGFVGSAMMRAVPADSVFHGFDFMDGWDLRNPDLLRTKIQQIGRVDRILHLAAIARFSDADADPLAAHEVNTVGTRNVAMVADEFRIPVVFGSTGSVYMPLAKEPPITEDFPALGNSVYGCSKRFAELYIEGMRSPWIILRYAHLYGPEKKLHGLIGGFVDKIKSGGRPILYGGEQTNDFTYITDVVSANLAALSAPPYAWRQTYNIGTGVELSARDAGGHVCRVWGYAGEPEIREQRGVDPSRFVYSCKRAENLLGWRAQVSFADGLQKMRESE